MKITYIRYTDIDKLKWDKAIDQSVNALVYGYSWYLDGITDGQWDALVYGDYEAVFPLPWKRKYGLKYIYQPFFCQQLGLFSPKGFLLSNSDFINEIPKSFVLIDLQLNLSKGEADLPGRLRANFRLDLNKPYEVLHRQFSQDVKNNLKKAEKGGIVFQFGIPYQQVMEVNRSAWGELNPAIQEHHYAQFARVCAAADEKGKLVTIGAYQQGELTGAALLFESPGYLFYVISGKTEAGKKTGVMNSIVNAIIKKYASSPLILDFEGSEIEGVAYFYKKFGSINSPYLHFKKYNLF